MPRYGVSMKAANSDIGSGGYDLAMRITKASISPEENRDWGYRRIGGALSTLGHEVARSTIGVRVCSRTSKMPMTWKALPKSDWRTSPYRMSGSAHIGGLHRITVRPVQARSNKRRTLPSPHPIS
jgi:hypothetical protein